MIGIPRGASMLARSAGKGAQKYLVGEIQQSLQRYEAFLSWISGRLLKIMPSRQSLNRRIFCGDQLLVVGDLGSGGSYE
jgi:hypothetical protein